MNPRPTSLLSLGAIVGLSLAMSACAGASASLDGPAPLNPAARYSLQAEPGLDRIALAVHETGLSSRQQSALTELVGRFARSGAQDLVVEAPAGGDESAAAMAWAIRSALIQAGVPAERLKLISYSAPAPKAPVLAGFETFTAVVPQCGQAWGSLTRTGDNQSASNFGCAVTANLAAQVAQPRDLVTPRAVTPADPARRSVVFENYAAGKVTTAQPEPRLTSARISQAVE